MVNEESMRTPLIADNPTETTVRHIDISVGPSFPNNAISNAKYTWYTFLPLTLFEQFRFFYNLYFLMVALSQIVPVLRIGYLSSYIVPLAFVLTITLSKEAWDDICRRRRDDESNRETYTVLNRPSALPVMSRDLLVGDIIEVKKDQRVPADLVLLKSTDSSGECFIRTDQLDGETDWKLRVPSPITQAVATNDGLTSVRITASEPSKDIHSFVGTLELAPETAPLSVDNTMWANTVLASHPVIGMVVYTGPETRQAMNMSKPRTKVGLLEFEINSISKILCVCVFLLSFILVAIHGFEDQWYISILKFLILFSSIIPVSLRVNLDLGKSVYAYQISHDRTIPGVIVRTSTIPEDLGRIEYLLTDKTGTLTQNDMRMRKLHIGTVSYSSESMDELKLYIAETDKINASQITHNSTQPVGQRGRRDIGNRVRDIVICLAVCHNVTPTEEENGEVTYQAASPDEIAIVKWTESIGIRLHRRDRTSITLYNSELHTYTHFKILRIFPFTSESKRMGIIVQDEARDEIWFFEKGADTVMTKIVQQNDWLEEETGNMAREGLRTLVIASKKLSDELYKDFDRAYTQASLQIADRDNAMAKVVSQYLEGEMVLLGLTGVEDKLQRNVKSSLELMRNAGVRIWMLTGDKVETAKCIAISSKLVSRGQKIYSITKLTSRFTASNDLAYLHDNPDCALLIDGQSLSFMISHMRTDFITTAVRLRAVIACRCSPTQKKDIAELIKVHTGKRVCCIGDGGNDVSMIQAAHVGVGIVGKEGKQASLAADFSITQFCHLSRLLVWHGRNSYKNSAKLSQFVIHRGLIISICQVVYSASSEFEPLALFQGWLLVGYATIYTMMPVFSLVLDRDVDEDVATLYPELYHELIEGQSLSYKTFFIWVLVSVYQGVVIQGLAQVLVGLADEEFTKLVAVGFTALILNELLMVAIEIITWHYAMSTTELLSGIIYFASIPFLGEYFDLSYIVSFGFIWKVLLILGASLLPPWITRVVQTHLNPPTYAKVQQG
ncbi:hypothetical protein CANCADRAFT_58598 [Tortispora caseinolytica NRRL Y-17796]|uniref:Phospholipid-transporting ATPase n=1 Tax=Tortispora caseinolytica NRRL Y-17796 TaxID=767744 RepID=A0A1E4TDL7_9ASCO|nr:hypothetical protein CANCADRAFT_58598 [Tortispora caseinolytica NRRL Y-17796]